MLKLVSGVWGRFVFTFEVDATPASVALPLWQKTLPLPLNGRAVLAPVCFENTRGEAVQPEGWRERKATPRPPRCPSSNCFYVSGWTERPVGTRPGGYDVGASPLNVA